MNNGKNFDSDKHQASCKAIFESVRELAIDCQGDTHALLALLRLLEQLHREIRDDYFVKTLPDNRQALYALLKDIESEGGWPYIERMKIKALLTNMEQESTHEKGVGGGV
jgi:hypothetical protein